jgi:hypothetical protein
MHIERDKKIQQLQSDVFGQLNAIINSLDPKKEDVIDNNVQFVDVESAIKELLAMGVK